MSDPTADHRQRRFQGVKFVVDEVTVPTAGGGTARREVVVHPGAVVVLGELASGEVVMIRNHRFAVARTLWELPAGTLEEDEDPAACARRELAEETGYEAGEVEPLCVFYTTPGICTERMQAFCARGLRHVGQQLEATEQIVVEPLPWARVLEMVRHGEIVDGKTMATLLFYDRFRAGR